MAHTHAHAHQGQALPQRLPQHRVYQLQQPAPQQLPGYSRSSCSRRIRSYSRRGGSRHGGSRQAARAPRYLVLPAF